ncbi:two-component sensor histidine kinase [Saccharothrix sp. 6-C]|uniref:sensor histidine kinase n=1 Tax=Saccharothrix sp. 6-C TaxID=2781735 RepID=UPI001916DF87|nr:histidine kinase [Saccharothrix sp. 6-C]QQQ78362.1 two-component sensor histidine kinase [Saccharothrix sp. 6-C]
MRNGVVLAALAVTGLVNGLATDVLPVWRQLLYPVLAVLVYLHARHRPVRRGELVVGAVAAAGLLIAAVRVWEGVGALGSLGLFVVLPWLAGRFRRQQAELIEAGRERIAQLERAQELVADRARLRERARIAADMHDSLGHELTLIALRAGALELTADTEPVRRAATGLRESAVTATDRLRRTVGVLREGAPTVEPPDETVTALVERAAEAGLPVALTRTGDTTPLPPLLDRAVHRVVQEALTNAARHAPGAPVTVELDITGEVLLTVTNPAHRTPSGDGSGLAGLAERVRLLGGTLRSGVADGRFTVTARLPLEGEA